MTKLKTDFFVDDPQFEVRKIKNNLNPHQDRVSRVEEFINNMSSEQVEDLLKKHDDIYSGQCSMTRKEYEEEEEEYNNNLNYITEYENRKTCLNEFEDVEVNYDLWNNVSDILCMKLDIDIKVYYDNHVYDIQDIDTDEYDGWCSSCIYLFYTEKLSLFYSFNETIKIQFTNKETGEIIKFAEL